MKNISIGVIFLIIMLPLMGVHSSCSNGNMRGAGNQTDSTNSIIEMEKRIQLEPELELETSLGTMTIKLYKKTPKHKENFLKLVNENYYEGMRFHRVIEGFMIQSGDPNSRDTSLIKQWGYGGPQYTIPAEIVEDYRHKRGAIAAARKGNLANPMKASSGSQFYIVHNEEACEHLDGEYTIFGEVIDGMEIVDKIASKVTDHYDRPYDDIFITGIRLIGPSCPLPQAEQPKSDSTKTTDGPKK